jgi:transposase
MEKELEVNNLRLSPREQEGLRLRIVRVAKKNQRPGGKIDVAKVAEICECSESHVRSTWRKYQIGGVGALKCIKMGRPGDSGHLTSEQQKEIREMIVDKCPDQLKLKGFLWDRRLVQELVKQKYGISIGIRAMGDYLNKWGFTPQRPMKRSYKQKPEEVTRWLEDTYPSIAQKAKEENAEVMWGDEVGVQNEANYIRGYAPMGQTPVLPVGNERLKVNMISAISNQGKLRFMFYKDTMTQQRFIEFLGRLIKGAERKILLIVDNLKVHHGKLVASWLAEHRDQIELFFLPPYSPEYNPDEYLNGNLKREMSKQGFSKSVDELKTKALGVMRCFGKKPKHVASFFNAKLVAYAA